MHLDALLAHSWRSRYSFTFFNPFVTTETYINHGQSKSFTGINMRSINTNARSTCNPSTSSSV